VSDDAEAPKRSLQSRATRRTSSSRVSRALVYSAVSWRARQ